MNLFKDFKYLADKINTKRKGFRETSLQFGKTYDNFLARSFREIDEALAKEGIDIRTNSGNFTKSKKIFESIPEKIQVNIIDRLKKIHTNARMGTPKKLQKAMQATHDKYIVTFIKVVGKSVWNEYCNEVGSEEKCKEMVIDAIIDERNKKGNQFNSEQVIIDTISDYMPDNELVLRAKNNLENQLDGWNRLSEKRNWGSGFFSNKE